jgi:hypothetical protein
MFVSLLLFILSLLHFLATLNTTSSSSPRSPSQKVPARQETTNSGSEAKASTIQPMLTKVSVETKQSKYTKHQKQIWKKESNKKSFFQFFKKKCWKLHFESTLSLFYPRDSNNLHQNNTVRHSCYSNMEIKSISWSNISLPVFFC